jgi:hemerythrin
LPVARTHAPSISLLLPANASGAHFQLLHLNKNINLHENREDHLLKRKFYEYRKKNTEMTTMQNIEEIGISLDDLNVDHTRLFNILGRIRKLAKTDCDPLIVGAALAELNEYTTFHFRREIAMMTACNYPDKAAHNQAHLKLEFKLDQLLNAQSLDENMDLCLHLQGFLEDWLVNHIMIMDKAFDKWAGENEVSAQ